MPQTILKTMKIGKLTSLFLNLLQIYSNQSNVEPAKKKKKRHRSMEWSDPQVDCQLVIDKPAKAMQWGSLISSL